MTLAWAIRHLASQSGSEAFRYRTGSGIDIFLNSYTGDRMPDIPAFKHLKDLMKMERDKPCTSKLQMVNLLFDA
jgi:hypothetical protein